MCACDDPCGIPMRLLVKIADSCVYTSSYPYPYIDESLYRFGGRTLV